MSERYWSGPDGLAYADRQKLSISARKALLVRMLSRAGWPKSIVEFGASTGDNLLAIRQMNMSASMLTGVEINEEACAQMAQIADLAICDSLLNITTLGHMPEMSMTRGVLIHIQPADLPKAYDVLYQNARKWICITEYYSPQPRMIPYRGRDGLLWARDFAGEMMDRYPDLALRDYYFTYHRDAANPQDDVTTFLMEKT